MNIAYNYVEEHNLEHLGVFEQILLIIQNNTAMAILTCIILGLATLSIIVLIVNKYFINNDTVMQLSLGYLLLCVMGMGIAMYMLNDKFQSIGHYESDVQVVDVDKSRAYAAVKSGKYKDKVKLDENQSVKKGDNVVVRTNTELYKNEEIKEKVSGLNLLPQDIKLQQKQH